MTRQPFHKTMGAFDRIEVASDGDDEWMSLTMHVGFDVKQVTMTFRSDEAVHDLHYAIGRYLAQLPTPSKEQS